MLTLLALAGCAQLPQASLDRAEALAHGVRPSASACLDSVCAIASPLLDRARELTAAGAVEPKHAVVSLERGDDALLARLHLIRAARESIELQSYIFVEDDIGWLLLNDLVRAARRGVRVRVLLDQLFSVDDVGLLASLATAHENLDIRLYNPTFGKASTDALEFGISILCCFKRFNQRMHNKLLRVDGVAAIGGGRNIQARYFDWDPNFNYRDRDLLVLGPAAAEMGGNFDAFWNHADAVPTERLHDVAAVLLNNHGPPRERPSPRLWRVERMAAFSALAADPERVRERLLAPAFEVGRVEYLADGPDKHVPDSARADDMSAGLRELLAGAEHSVVLQTPYLVLSRPARKVFRDLRRRESPPEVLVSTNSLAATDAWPVYAMSHKYKRTYLRDLGLDIREYKPYPNRAPRSPYLSSEARMGELWTYRADDRDRVPWLAPRPEWLGSVADPRGRAGSDGPTAVFARHRPVPLARAGPRFGMHAKSLLVDGRIAVVGTHNFDPRSDDLNTESAIIVHDVEFALALEQVIRVDAAPDNAWVIAPRARAPIFSGLDYSIGKVFEWLPLFDLWPFRYATSYEREPECPQAEPADDLSRSPCWRAVGAFPDVDVPLKSLYTRLMTAFGAGLQPIL